MRHDLLERKRHYFVLWLPGIVDPAPALVIGVVEGGALDACREIPLAVLEDQPDLWGVAAAGCDLEDGQVYWYWFKVTSTDPYTGEESIILCTDPLAWTVDRRFTATAPDDPAGAPSGQPAAVVLFQNGELVPCDPDGGIADWVDDPPLETLPPNNRMVLYELPVRWAHIRRFGSAALGDGTFRDVLALLTPEAADLPDVHVYQGRGHLEALGINALELLPPADSDYLLEWGYGTANFLAASYYLGHPDPEAAPTATGDLIEIVRACHHHGMRLFVDMVMAFGRACPYRQINFADFYVRSGSGDSEEEGREGFGGDLWKYNYWIEGYQPRAGTREQLVPAREFMYTYLAHWMQYYRVDGLRLDSVENIRNWDFVQEFTGLAHHYWRARGGSEDRFIVVGEDLHMPMDIVTEHRIDGLWNERFKGIIRRVLLGEAADGFEGFEESVRALIDCRIIGFEDGSQAVNYLTSHDVGGLGNERLYNWLQNNGVLALEERIKLAFTCLLTAVGIPMILAGDEFGEEHDLNLVEGKRADNRKQMDPINFERMQDQWRQRLFVHVARLTRLRTSADALAINETEFFHSDFADGKRIVAWRRGHPDAPVVVVANFSDHATAQSADPDPDYPIENWPETPAGSHWHEVTQDRIVDDAWIGREPLAPWEARVYVLA